MRRFCLELVVHYRGKSLTGKEGYQSNKVVQLYNKTYTCMPPHNFLLSYTHRTETEGVVKASSAQHPIQHQCW